MILRIYYKALMFATATCLLGIIVVPAAHTGRAAWPLGVVLTLGTIAIYGYSRPRPGRALGSIENPGRVGMLLAMIFILPVGMCAVAIIGDLEHRKMAVFGEATKIASGSDIVAQQVGVPFKVGWPIEGESDETSHSGRAELLIPISGIRGKRMLQVEATKNGATWNIDELYLNERYGAGSQSIPVPPS